MKNLGNKTVMAQNIKRYMAENGINSPKELSDALSEKYTTVLSWVNGEYYPRIDKIEKMAAFFGCVKSDLIEEKKKPAPVEGELSEKKRELLEVISNLSEREAALLLASLKSELGKP